MRPVLTDAQYKEPKETADAKLSYLAAQPLNIYKLFKTQIEKRYIQKTITDNPKINTDAVNGDILTRWAATRFG